MRYIYRYLLDNLSLKNRKVSINVTTTKSEPANYNEHNSVIYGTTTKAGLSIRLLSAKLSVGKIRDGGDHLLTRRSNTGDEISQCHEKYQNKAFNK